MKVAPQGSGEPVTKTERCRALVREMIMSGELLPGEKVHQGMLADRLALSRIPVREALNRLHEEGLLEHRPNVGYTVARLNLDDLLEIYLMRELLENEVYKSLNLATMDTDHLRRLNAELSAVPADDVDGVFRDLNLKFHFYIFNSSPLNLVVKEVERLWRSAGIYHAIYMAQAHTGPRINSEHEKIIDAIEADEIDGLIEANRVHRNSTLSILLGRIGPARARRNNLRLP